MTEQTQFSRERIVVVFFQQIGTTGYTHAKNLNLDADLIHLTKINSIWITALNVKYQTIKLLDDNRGENLDDFGYSNDFSDTIPKT